MIWFILGIIITLCITIYWGINDDWGFALLMGFLVFLIALLAALLITGLCSCGISKDQTNYEIQSTKNVVALVDNLTVDGRTGFLGSGHIDGELQYYYMVETDIGRTVKKVDADDTYVRYTNEQPRIETYKSVSYKKKWYHVFAIPADTYHIIYIPEGSIIENYQIDLK